MRTTSTTALLYAAAVASLVSAPHAALAFSGDMTYYNTETGNQGACGGFLSNSDYLVALNAPQYYEVPPQPDCDLHVDFFLSVAHVVCDDQQRQLQRNYFNNEHWIVFIWCFADDVEQVELEGEKW
ncbi:hypothetical protein DFJ73DRAFT_760185 [Zopfochytrium polystomum]|nr:hypothetical protein DFJ73DRAFT_760185 [Zopfochytrium polystomum]